MSGHLILVGVNSRYLIGEGFVQEAIFMSDSTGDEFQLGLVEGQYEALLDILRAGDANEESTEEANADEPVSPAPARNARAANFISTGAPPQGSFAAEEELAYEEDEEAGDGEIGQIDPALVGDFDY